MQSTQDEIEVEGEEIDEKSGEEPAASSTAQTTEARSEDEEPPTTSTEDQRSEFVVQTPLSAGPADDPYEFERCAITASVVWLPTDDHPAGRQMLVGVRSHLDAPILRVFREADLPLVRLPQVLEGLLEELRTELPNRQVDRLRRTEAETQKKPRTHQGASHPKQPNLSAQAATQSAQGQAPSPAQLNLFQAFTQSPQETPK